MKTSNHKTKTADKQQEQEPLRSSDLLDHTVTVAIGDKLVWQRRHENGNPGGITARNKSLLESVVPILGDAIMQAQGELSLLLDDNNRVADGRFITLADIKRDVPVTRTRRNQNSGELPIKSSAIGAALAALEAVKLGVAGKHDVALGVTGNANNVPVVQILSCVDELHNVVVLVWSNIRS
jgi:hypothetical protein